MPTAAVTLNVTTFNASPTPCVISRPDIHPGGGGNRVKYKNPANLNDYTIVTMKKGAASLDIAFNIPGCTFPAANATPVTFAGANAGANFPTQVVDNASSTVTVTNVFANCGNGSDNPSWKYSIAIVSAAGVQGFIDPIIENEN